MIDDLIQDATRRMDKSVEATQVEFNTVRTGRASAALLDRITVDYYGQPTPLKQLATINVPEPRMLTVQPFDPSSIKEIERAILESELGLTPSNDGKVIRLPIPQLTEERRKELVKIVRQIAEDGRIAIRNVRRDADKHLKDLKSKGERRRRRRAARGGSCPEAHGRAHEQDRRPAEAQGSGDHRGLGGPGLDGSAGLLDRLQELALRLDSRRVLSAIGTIIVLLGILAVLELVFGSPFGIFDLNGERNVPAVFSAALWTCVSVARAAPGPGRATGRRRAGLAGAFRPVAVHRGGRVRGDSRAAGADHGSRLADPLRAAWPRRAWSLGARRAAAPRAGRGVRALRRRDGLRGRLPGDRGGRVRRQRPAGLRLRRARRRRRSCSRWRPRSWSGSRSWRRCAPSCRQTQA